MSIRVPARTMVKVCTAFSLLLSITLSLAGQTREVAGTGFLISTDGYILTNYHVVEGAFEPIEVQLHDGTTYTAKLIDHSPVAEEKGYDVALLKIEAGDLSTLRLGDSDRLDLFEEVIVMGYPLSFDLGVDLNITSGNINSFRTLPDASHLEYLQIDAAINPGNSGGPVLNETGEVIGVATARITQIEDTDIQGVSFAIPIKHAIALVERNISGWASAGPDLSGISKKEFVKRAAPAVVYIKWTERCFREGRYIEDFSVKREWFAENWDSKGFVEMSLSDEQALEFLECPCEASTSIAEVDIVFTKGEAGGAGLAFFVPEDQGYQYCLSIDWEGWYRFLKRPGREHDWVWAGQWEQSRHLNKGLQQLNHVKIEIKDWQTIVHFNGQRAGSLNVKLHPGGTVGLVVVNFEETTAVRFDNFHLYTKPGSATEMLD